MENSHLTQFLMLEFARVEEKAEVISNGSKNDAFQGMTRRSGQLDGMGVQRECLGAWGCRISKLILEATRNLEILKANWKAALELAILLVEGDQLKTVKGFLCFAEAPRLCRTF